MAEPSDILAQYNGPSTADVLQTMPQPSVWDNGGTQPSHTTADVLARMPTPSWHDQYVKPFGSAYPREPWAWTRDYPNLAKFLAEAITTAPLALRPSAASMPRPRFAPEHTVEAYHGTPKWEGDSIRTPFWMHEGTSFPHRFSGERGAILPLEVDTSNYLNIPHAGWLEKLDGMIGHGRQMERLEPGGRNWLADIAKGLGKSGIRWEQNWHDYGPAMVAFDPRTIRGKYGAFSAAETSTPLLKKYGVAAPVAAEILSQYGADSE